MPLEYFCAYHSYLKALEPLNMEERGRLFTRLLEYSATGDEKQITGNERFVYPMMRDQIDRDKARYQEKCSKQSQNAKKRWNAEPCRGIPVHAEDAKTKEKEKTKTKTKENNITRGPARESSTLSPEAVFENFAGENEDLRKELLDFLVFRREKKKPVTATAASRICKKLTGLADEARVKDKTGYMIAVLSQSMERGWDGLFEYKGDFKDKCIVHKSPGGAAPKPRRIRPDEDISKYF